MQRFWDNMDKSGGENACWIWQACRSPKGYGSFKVRGQIWRAHRLALVLSGQDVPKGVYVCHHCDVPSCVNPKHLYIGSAFTNVHDAIERGRIAKGAANGMSTHPETRGFLSRNPQSKLTEAEYAELFSLRKDGWSYSQLVRRFGITKQSIASLLRNHIVAEGV